MDLKTFDNERKNIKVESHSQISKHSLVERPMTQQHAASTRNQMDHRDISPYGTNEPANLYNQMLINDQEQPVKVKLHPKYIQTRTLVNKVRKEFDQFREPAQTESDKKSRVRIQMDCPPEDENAKLRKKMKQSLKGKKQSQISNIITEPSLMDHVIANPNSGANMVSRQSKTPQNRYVDQTGAFTNDFGMHKTNDQATSERVDTK